MKPDYRPLTEQLFDRVDAATRSRLESPEAGGLQERLEGGVEAARTYGIDASEMLDYLGQRVPDSAKVARALANWQTEELALCLACARGDQGAVGHFRQQHLRTVSWTLKKLRLPPDQVDELEQRVLVRLLVGDEGRPPLLERFHGLGKLDGWLRVVTASTAHDLLRKQGRSKTFNDERVAERVVESGASPELKQAKLGYRAAFGDAFRQALRQLPAPDLRLMRYRFADDLTFREIATIYRVNHATILRRLERVKLSLLAGTQQNLRQLLDVGDTECKSIIRLIQSDFAVTMKTFFGDWGAGADGKT